MTCELFSLQGVYDVTQDDRYKTGEMGEDELLREFLDKFDSPDNRDGTVTKEEFISYYAGNWQTRQLWTYLLHPQ